MDSLDSRSGKDEVTKPVEIQVYPNKCLSNLDLAGAVRESECVDCKAAAHGVLVVLVPIGVYGGSGAAYCCKCAKERLPRLFRLYGKSVEYTMYCGCKFTVSG